MGLTKPALASLLNTLRPLATILMKMFMFGRLFAACDTLNVVLIIVSMDLILFRRGEACA